IKERFKALDITTDWRRFDRISEVRNDVEHYYAEVGKPRLLGLISDACILVRDFLTLQLHENPRELLDDAWQEMLDISEVFERERAECEGLLERVEWESGALATGIVN